MAYVRSPLFKASIQVCTSFKLISDIARFNETNGRDPHMAGPNFVKKFKLETQGYDGIEKVKIMVFTSNEEIAKNKFLSIGFEEPEIPKITTDAKQFVEFLSS
jgi:hypothetical protein